MKKYLKIIATVSAVLAGIVAIAFVLSNLKPVDLQDRAAQLEAYCEEHGYNTDYGILVDYGRFSLQRRLFVYDFNQDKIVLKSLSGHGKGGDSTILTADFSNEHGSYCSSIGHYRVGRHRNMYNRPMVPAIEVNGLDKTNSNAMKRGILIHPGVGPLSLGCVTLPVFRYMQVSELLESLPHNVIMWIYE